MINRIQLRPEWLAILLVALSLSACATTVPVSVLAPARYPEASNLREIYIEPVRGRGGREVTDILSTTLARHYVEGQPFFTVSRIPANARGVYTANILDRRADREQYQVTRYRCVRRGDDDCADRVPYQVPCWRYYVDLDVTIDLVDRQSGQVVYSSQARGSADDSRCRGDGDAMSYDQLTIVAAQQVANQVLADVAPHERRFNVQFQSADDTLDDAEREIFSEAMSAARNGNTVYACSRFTELAVSNPQSASATFNSGLCHEIRGESDQAYAAYTAAAQLDPNIGRSVQAALARLQMSQAGTQQLADIENQAQQEAAERAAQQEARRAALAAQRAAAEEEARRRQQAAAAAEAAERAELAAEFGEENVDAILAGRVEVGFTQDAVRAAIGDPRTIERISSSEELWTYPDRRIVFLDGEVSFIDAGS